MSTTNPLGIHALVFAGDTTDASVDRIIDGAATAGFDIVEFSLHDLAHLDTARTRAKLDRAGLKAACSRGLAFDADPSSDDPDIVRRGADLLYESLQAAADLGAFIFTGALYGAFGKHDRPITPKGMANAATVLRDLAQVARPLGVTLGVEICNRYETNVVNTARQGLDLIEAIGADGVVLHLDSYHMNIEENDIVTPVLEAGAKLGYVHVGENHRGYLGSGHLDFTGLFRALATAGYTGPITFESFSSTVVAPGLSVDLSIWRNLWTDGAGLARHARQYLATQLQAHASA